MDAPPHGLSPTPPPPPAFLPLPPPRAAALRIPKPHPRIKPSASVSLDQAFMDFAKQALESASSPPPSPAPAPASPSPASVPSPLLDLLASQPEPLLAALAADVRSLLRLPRTCRLARRVCLSLSTMRTACVQRNVFYRHPQAPLGARPITHGTPLSCTCLMLVWMCCTVCCVS